MHPNVRGKVMAMTYRVIAFAVLVIPLLALPHRLDVTAAAQDTFALSGRVTTDFGCAIPGASVVISSVAAPSEVLAKTVTDADGRYSFDRLPDTKGPVNVVVSGDGFSRIERTMVIARNHPNLWDAGLPLARLFDPGRRVAGAVVHQKKRPVTDATVSLVRPHIDGRLSQVRTDKEGRFVFDNVDEGAFVVMITRPAYEAASRLVESTRSDSNAAPETFTLAPCKRCPTGRLD
jgi:hypothetical protein